MIWVICRMGMETDCLSPSCRCHFAVVTVNPSLCAIKVNELKSVILFSKSLQIKDIEILKN
jgi:hypothetical protein